MLVSNVRDLLVNEWGISTSPRENPITASIPTTVTQILRNDPKRLTLVIINLSANSVYVAPNNRVATTNGIYLVPNGGAVSLLYRDDYQLCTSEWWAISNTGTNAIYVLENLIVEGVEV